MRWSFLLLSGEGVCRIMLRLIFGLQKRILHHIPRCLAVGRHIHLKNKTNKPVDIYNLKFRVHIVLHHVFGRFVGVQDIYTLIKSAQYQPSYLLLTLGCPLFCVMNLSTQTLKNRLLEGPSNIEIRDNLQNTSTQFLIGHLLFVSIWSKLIITI